MAKFLGLDYGKVRIGVAVSDENASVAFGRKVILNDNNMFVNLKNLIKEENIFQIILGLPLSLKGEKTAQTLLTEKFEEELQSYLIKSGGTFSQIKIIKWDERFTSSLAADSLLASGMKKKKRQDKKNIDIISAALILQSYLDNLKNKNKINNLSF